MTTSLRQSPSGPIVEIVTTTDDLLNGSLVPGATATSALDALETRLRVVEEVEIVEYFQGGLLSFTGAGPRLGVFGDNAWSFFGSAANSNIFRPSDSVNRFGRYSLSVGTSIRCGLMLGSSTTPARGFGFLPTQITSAIWTGNTNSGSGVNGVYRYGLGTSPVSTTLGNDGIFFEVDRFIGTQWRCVARRAGAQTTTVSTIASTPDGTYFKLAIYRETNGDFRFEVNDVVAGTLLAANIPLLRISPIAQVQATVNSGQSIVVDTFQMKYQRAA